MANEAHNRSFLGSETRMLESLDRRLQDNKRRERITKIVNELIHTLESETDDNLIWKSMPLSFFGSKLPLQIRSSWVFVMRPNTMTGAERHPNSHQRMMSFRGEGDLQVKKKRKWCSNLLISDPALPLEKRWVSIPPMTWHQPVTGDDYWAVVSFHTVRSKELLEERPAGRKIYTKRRYTDYKF